MEAKKKRFNKVISITGGRGSGKSLYVLGSNYTSKKEDKDLKLPGLFDLYLKVKKMKVLIVDTIDHPAYREIPVMPINKLKDWKSGIYRILIQPDDIGKLCKLLNSLDSLWNTAIFFEDAYKHTSKSVCRSMAQLIGDTKQKNIDIFFMYWAYGQMPTDLFRLLDLIECFKTNDTPECRKSFMPGYFDKAMAIYNQVKNDKFPFSHKTIDTGRE
jgi:hypothetical protein